MAGLRSQVVRVAGQSGCHVFAAYFVDGTLAKKCGRHPSRGEISTIQHPIAPAEWRLLRFCSLLCYPENGCRLSLLYTHAGCTTGKPASLVWTTTGWSGRSSGGLSGRASGLAVTAFFRPRPIKSVSTISARTILGRWSPATSFFLT